MKRIIALSIVLFLAANTFATLDWSCPGRQTLVSTNSNDGFNGGRGVSFLMTENFQLNSFAVKLDLASTDVNIEIAQITSNPTSDSVSSGRSILYTDTQTFACNEDYATFDFTESIVLEANKSYHINISHSTNAQQNFFFNEDVDSDGNHFGYSQGTRWTVGSFSLIDGTCNFVTNNTVIADFLVNDSIHMVSSEPTAQSVPEPATIFLLTIGSLALMRRKK